MCEWYNSYQCEKWNWQPEFKLWLRFLLSLCANDLEKGRNIYFLPTAIGKLVGHIRLINFGRVTCLGGQL